MLLRACHRPRDVCPCFREDGLFAVDCAFSWRKIFFFFSRWVSCNLGKSKQHVCFRYMQNLVSFYFWSVLVTEFCQVTSNLSKKIIESKRNNVSYVSNINNHMVYGGVCFHWNFLFWPVLNRFAWFSLLILSSSIRVVYFDHYFNSSRPTHYKNGQIALP